MASKERILVKIRAANVTKTAFERRAVEREPVSIERFCERVSEYRATVHRSQTEELPELIASLCEGGRVLIPAGLPFEPKDAVLDLGFSHAALVEFDTTITTCAVGIEESGTIVLDAGPGQGRRAITLIPDHHICIIREDQIVATLEEALERLEPSRPLTFISGPSATSDIELVRVEGVHGPRKLEVVVVPGKG